MTIGKTTALSVALLMAAWPAVLVATTPATTARGANLSRAKATKVYIKAYEYFATFRNREALVLFLKARKLLSRSSANAGLHRTLLFHIAMANSRLGRTCLALDLFQQYQSAYRRGRSTKVHRWRKAEFEVKRLQMSLNAARRRCASRSPSTRTASSKMSPRHTSGGTARPDTHSSRPSESKRPTTKRPLPTRATVPTKRKAVPDPRSAATHPRSPGGARDRPSVTQRPKPKARSRPDGNPKRPADARARTGSRPPVAALPDSEHSGGRRLAAWITAGLGVVALSIGGGYGWKFFRDSDLANRYEKIGETMRASSLGQSKSTSLTVGLIGLGAGASFGISSWLLFRSSGRRSASRVRAVYALPAPGGFLLAGDF